jgi:hypothetical protein
MLAVPVPDRVYGAQIVSDFALGVVGEVVDSDLSGDLASDWPHLWACREARSRRMKGIMLQALPCVRCLLAMEKMGSIWACENSDLA